MWHQWVRFSAVSDMAEGIAARMMAGHVSLHLGWPDEATRDLLLDEVMDLANRIAAGGLD